jgi:hypothetical protein
MFFEVQFTSGGIGWVVVHLDGVERDELAEHIFEAWRLTAPAVLVDRLATGYPTDRAGSSATTASRRLTLRWYDS